MFVHTGGMGQCTMPQRRWNCKCKYKALWQEYRALFGGNMGLSAEICTRHCVVPWTDGDFQSDDPPQHTHTKQMWRALLYVCTYKYSTASLDRYSSASFDMHSLNVLKGMHMHPLKHIPLSTLRHLICIPLRTYAFPPALDMHPLKHICTPLSTYAFP